jgi:transcription factor E
MADISGMVGNVLGESLGEDSVEIIRLIDKPKEDKEISKKLNCETSKVRAVLNDLLEKNLVHLDRDRLDTGYCYYKWVRREDKLKEYADKYIEERIKQLDALLSAEEDIMFECGCNRFDYGTAIERGFMCPDCGTKLSHATTSKGSKKIKDEMKRLTSLKQAA